MHPRLAALLLAFSSAAALLPAQGPRPFDLILSNALIHDGRGNKPVRGDVAIRGTRIVAVGQLDKAASRQRVDLEGLVLAPGFIDTHAHADAVALRRPQAQNFIAMGVTSIITGNCGRSMRDVGQHLRAMRKRGCSVNYGSLIGHGTLRSKHMKGDPQRPPTAAELEAMCAAIDAQMQAGAVGMSTGLIYIPGTFADTDELIALCKAVARHGGIYATHMRGEGHKSGPRSIAEALRIGEEAGLPVHISHLKASGKRAHGMGKQLIALIRAAREAGQEVTADQYAYAASSTGLDVLFPSEELAKGRVALIKRLKADPELQAAIKRRILRSLKSSGFADFEYCQVSFAPNNTEHNGKRITEIAEAFYGRKDLQAQADTIVRLMMDSGGKTRVSMVYHKMSEQDVETIMAADFVGVACDAGIRATKGTSVPHPRGAGNNPRVLGYYVRERKVLSLAHALRKMCSLPAQTFGLKDRGEIRVGAFADLVVFDPATVRDGATFKSPRTPPVGIRRVYVNGVLTMQNNKHTGAKAGMILRRG